MTGNHDLPGCIEVGGSDDFQLGGFTAQPFDSLGVSADDRGHRALTFWHGLLHRLATQVHEPHRIFERQAACGDERAVLAERVAGCVSRQRNVGRTLAQRGERCHAGRDDGRLRVVGEHELAVGTLEAELGELPAERGIGAFEHVARRGRRIEERTPHPDFLRALSRKEPGEHVSARATQL